MVNKYHAGPHAGKNLVSNETAKAIVKSGQANRDAAMEKRGSPAGKHKYKNKGPIMD
jgi:hypothetical protein